MLLNIIKQKQLKIMSAFIQNLNPLTGLNEWVVQDENYDYHQEVARAAFADMLHDTERNNMYEEALKVAIEHMHSRGRKANVLDIGTGTGLLSMMAVRHNADSVVACEAFQPMSRCALEIIKLNNYEDKIKVIPKRSTDIILGTDMEFKANILVTEVFDTELIGEGALGTFQHAHKNLLEEDCIVVPHSGTIYAQIIESPLLANWNRLNNIFNDDGELELKIPNAIKSCRGSANFQDLQLSQIPKEFVKDISQPESVFRFDFSGRTPFIFERSSINTIRANRSGIAQGVFMWWDLNMDLDNKIVLSCAPYWAHPSSKPKNEIPWRDHWMQAIYYFPKELHITKDEEISLISCHDEYSLWFNIKKDLNILQEDYNSPQCTCQFHNAYARTRIGQLNDARRLKKYLKLIEKYIDKESIVMVLSQGFYAALTVAKYAKKVYFLETNHTSRHVTEAMIKENHLDNVEIFEGDEKLGDKANIVLAEPYYMSSIVPWDNLQLLHLLRKVKESLTDDVQVFPQRAAIKAVAVQFDNLHKIRAPLKKCNGFLMKPFDLLIEQSCELADDLVEAQPLWEYPGIAVSDSMEIATIDLKVPTEDTCIRRFASFTIKDGYKCNGIAVWIDWILDEQDVKTSTVTSGPVTPIQLGEYIHWDMHSRQGVCLLGNREMPSEFEYMLKCDFANESSTIEFKPVPKN